jgi:calcineurin-like phosphoesterase family protein
MADIWFISDTHFFHDNILHFKDTDGKNIRGQFADVNEMNWTMVENWNKVVKPQDKVWHLGDVAFKTTAKADEVAHLLRSLHGHKRLVVGNHDNLKAPCLMNNFEKVELWKGFPSKYLESAFTCSHIPLRKDSLRDGRINVHGHLHQNLMKEKGYISVCVEQRNFTPVHMDEILKECKSHI